MPAALVDDRLLKPVGDLARLTSRATLGVAHARDLVGLRACLAPLDAIREAAALLDVDLLRWTGESGSYNIVVRADGLPLVWRLPDGKPRTPGAATIELQRGDVIRIERTDRGGKGALDGRDAQWSVAVTK